MCKCMVLRRPLAEKNWDFDFEELSLAFTKHSTRMQHAHPPDLVMESADVEHKHK